MKQGQQYEVVGTVWMWPGDGAWHFLTVEPKLAKEIREMTADFRRGFGSVRVRACISELCWETSIFPTKEGEYVLPIKKEIRKKAEILEGSKIKVLLNILVGR